MRQGRLRAGRLKAGACLLDAGIQNGEATCHKTNSTCLSSDKISTASRLPKVKHITWQDSVSALHASKLTGRRHLSLSTRHMRNVHVAAAGQAGSTYPSQSVMHAVGLWPSWLQSKIEQEATKAVLQEYISDAHLTEAASMVPWKEGQKGMASRPSAARCWVRTLTRTTRQQRLCVAFTLCVRQSCTWSCHARSARSASGAAVTREHQGMS